jgi:hypothetical protein
MAMGQVESWLKGRKTYFLATGMFSLALAALVNGWGSTEIAALGGSIAALTATMRAAVEKSGPNGGPNIPKVVILTLATGALLTFMVGCAGLGVVDPATGTTPAQDIVSGAQEFSMILPPPLNTMVPVGVAGLLTILTAIGKAKAASPQPE